MKLKEKDQHSTKISAFNIDEITKDVEALIAKYYGGGKISLITESTESKTGFFLMFITRDQRKGSGSLKTRTFGSDMSIADLMTALEDALKNILSNADKGPVGLA